MRVILYSLAFFMLFTAQIGVPKFEHNFGIVKPDEIVNYTFEIENNDNQVLVVESIEGG